MHNPVPTAAIPASPSATPSGTPTLQPLDYTSLRAVLAELEPVVVPSRFEKAQQSDAHTLQLGLRGLQGTQWLELSWLAEAPRLLAIPPPPRQGDGSTLAQQLQHGLRGLALVALHQPAWERVVELRFAPRPGEPVERSLLLELMGRHSNLFLLDGERRVIALARQVRDRQSRLRPIGTGDPYQPPPSQAGEPPRPQESFESWRQRLSLLPLPLGKALLGAYQGTSPALVRQLLADPSWAALPVHALSDSQWQALWQRWRQWLDSLERSCFELQWGPCRSFRCWLPGPRPESLAGASAPPGLFGQERCRDAGFRGEPPDGASCGSNAQPSAVVAGAAPAVGVIGSGGAFASAAGEATVPAAVERDGSGRGRSASAVRSAAADASLPINRGLAEYYGARLAERTWRQRRQTLETRLRNAMARELELLAQQQALLDAVPAAEELQRRADGLLCLPEPTRETIDEAQGLYRRARKLRRSVAAITPRIALHRQHLEGLETSLTFLDQLDRDAELAPLEEELLEQLERLRPRGAGEPAGGRSRGRRRQGGQGEPQPLELRSSGGLRLQVGRNHRQNEWISLRQARRGDLWFHAQELPGSHVVLKGSEAPPGEADLQAAADLAAHFSRGRGNRRVPVLMVAAETLQRIPGAEPGTVRHRGGEVLWGEPERAQALLQVADRPAEPGSETPRAEPKATSLQGEAPTGPSAAGAS
ncbi:NFACT family protein [Synechococcus sp. CBW1004]|uniref:Rqc2 family fibronectin-binding protein n=1 Tax=Synechococcus sp. CBW1004 TaxID=1353136 RepID=UPI00351AEED6